MAKYFTTWRGERVRKEMEASGREAGKSNKGGSFVSVEEKVIMDEKRDWSK